MTFSQEGFALEPPNLHRHALHPPARPHTTLFEPATTAR